jgi:hypothetical protein
MNRKRIVIGIGLFAGGIAMVACARHCRRVMSERGGAGHSCLPASRRPRGIARRSDEDRGHELPALAA